MSDLRDRIAKVLYRRDYDLRDWEKATDAGKQPYYDDANAVIEALNLDVAVTYLSADKLRREVCVEGYYTVEVNDV